MFLHSWYKKNFFWRLCTPPEQLNGGNSMKMYAKFDLNEKMELSLITVIYERAVTFMREGALEGFYPPRRTDDEGDIVPCFCNCQDILNELTAYSSTPAVARERLEKAVHGAATLINYHFRKFGTHNILMDWGLCERTVMSGIRHESAVGFLIR